MNVLSQPPIAFLIYIVLVSILSGAARVLAGAGHPNVVKSSAYASGEKGDMSSITAPGYRPFFRIALFFAILHLGAVILGSGGLTPTAGVYLLGLMLALIALILG